MNYKQLWASDHFYKQLFGKKLDFNEPFIRKLRWQLNNLPEQDSYNIIGYGSLLNENSLKRTIKEPSNPVPVFILGYERIFNVGNWETGAFLNIREAKDSMMICNKITIKAKEMPEYLIREGLYDLIEVKYKNINNDEYGKAYTVISNDFVSSIQPQLNYLHMCIDGIINLAGRYGARNFMDTTYCYSQKNGQLIKLSQWLEEVDLKQLMINQQYISR